MANPVPRTTSQPIEITLPSGIFARISPVSFMRKLLASGDAVGYEAKVKADGSDEEKDLTSGHIWCACLLSRAVLFDDKRLTVAEVLALDSRDTDAVLQHLLPYMSGPVR